MNKKEVIINVTRDDYEKMKAKGIDEEAILNPGKHIFRRTERVAKREDSHPSNAKVEFQMKLDSDVLKHFVRRAESEEIEALQLLLNEKLRAVMEDELKLEEIENKLLNDKKFIAALAEEVKKAA